MYCIVQLHISALCYSIAELHIQQYYMHSSAELHTTILYYSIAELHTTALY